MHWTVAGPVVCNPGDRWLTPFVPSGRHTFDCIPRRDKLANSNWHERSASQTTFQEWQGIWQQANEAFQTTRGGVITTLPQAAALVGLQQRLSRRQVPAVAWMFDMNYYPGLKHWLARQSLKHINRFIVHSRIERKIYSQWLNIPIERFEFVPFQMRSFRPDELYSEDIEQPFIVTTGSACRDFPTLFEAVKKLNIRTIVISGPRALSGLDIPPQVETPFGLKKAEIHRLVQQARLNIVPLEVPRNSEQSPPGIVTIVEAMRLGRPVIATQHIGIDDYITDGETGLLVEPYSVDALANAIDSLWHDQALRKRMGAAASQYASAHFSDEAAGATLGRILDEVECESSYASFSVPSQNLQLKV